MTKEYLYPSLGDRQSVSDWLEAGALTVWDKAIARVSEIEALPVPTHLPADIEAVLRERLPIHLSEGL